ncbi:MULTISPECIES: hypothetical protein [unclassified Microcoleus]|uniref:hypothetical protein n=1 Tax=unclassified Microcoleus TaxID=2642155 RepID=UPI001DE08A39|nr:MULTISPECIES: hypothetical protein [unclassified Microcoleus]MCC3433926.1 hypothetical protein [Microcoleus sp. PH2017_05_CCC_O_A]MCC3583009.1 hypothetical protein [Microcoleus sp. PH2017_30_WIL_O_A]
MTVKAISATILLGAIPLHVYQLPDGGYKVDAIGVMGAVDKKGSALTKFLAGKSA